MLAMTPPPRRRPLSPRRKNQTHLWQIENGTVNVGLDILCRLADALEVNVGDLIDF